MGIQAGIQAYKITQAGIQVKHTYWTGMHTYRDTYIRTHTRIHTIIHTYIQADRQAYIHTGWLTDLFDDTQANIQTYL